MDNDFQPGRRPAKSRVFRQNKPPVDQEQFRTPEEAAAADAQSQEPPAAPVNSEGEETIDMSGPEPPKEPGGWRDKLALHWPPDKKTAVIIIVIVLLLGGGAFALVKHYDSQGPAIPAIKPVPKKTSDTVPSTLTGLLVDPSVNQRPVTGVMIENTPAARPQSGLGQAGVVFEAIAEAGITRFLALYQDTAPNNVGPIRSARPYFVQWDLGFDAPYAHVGGSPEALSDIKAWNVRDLNQFYNGSYFHRISTRQAPHNVYTSLSDLTQLEESKGYTSSNFTGFARKTDSPSKHPTAVSINFNISSADYAVHYAYNPAHDDYLRSEGGQPQIDANTNTQISPKVVIALVIPYSLGSLDSSGAYYSVYNTIGSGQAYVFQDGIVTIGEWSKPSNTAQISFSNSSGKTIRLNPGQTWLTAVGTASDVSYTP